MPSDVAWGAGGLLVPAARAEEVAGGALVPCEVGRARQARGHLALLLAQLVPGFQRPLGAARAAPLALRAGRVVGVPHARPPLVEAPAARDLGKPCAAGYYRRCL